MEPCACDRADISTLNVHKATTLRDTLAKVKCLSETFKASDTQTLKTQRRDKSEHIKQLTSEKKEKRRNTLHTIKNKTVASLKKIGSVLQGITNFL